MPTRTDIPSHGYAGGSTYSGEFLGLLRMSVAIRPRRAGSFQPLLSGIIRPCLQLSGGGAATSGQSAFPACGGNCRPNSQPFTYLTRTRRVLTPGFRFAQHWHGGPVTAVGLENGPVAGAGGEGSLMAQASISSRPVEVQEGHRIPDTRT